MTEPLFTRRQHGSALEQLMQLRDMARRAPAAEAVEAAPVEAFAANADGHAAAPAAGGAAAEPGAAYVDDAARAAGVVGNDPDGLARAAQAAAAAGVADPAYAGVAQQIVGVQVQPRLLLQAQNGPIVIPVDVPVPAAQPHVVIAPPTAVVVDQSGQVIAQPAAAAAAGGTPAPAPRANFRNMGAEDFGNLFRRGGAAQAAAPAAAEGAGAAAPAAAGNARPSLLDQLRDAAGQLHRPNAAPAAEEAAAAVADAAPAAGKPSLMDQLRGAAGQLHAPAAGADEAANGGARVLDGLREGIAGIGALRIGAGTPAAGAAAEAAEAAPKLGDKLMAALQAGIKINPRG